MSTQTSAIQMTANQANAQKSTGPRTEEGKASARFNARRHGLTGQFYCLSEDDEIAYKAFEANLLLSLQPVGAYETQLAISITQDQWRVNRSKAMEFNLFGLGHSRFADPNSGCSPNVEVAAASADTWRDESRIFGNLALYETRLHRMIARNRKDLQDLQARRIADEKAALEEVQLLVKLANFMEDKPETVGLNPIEGDTLHANGFVFSLAAIRAKLRREHNLEIARSCEKRGWDRDRIEIQQLPDLLDVA